ncbi:MAG: 6-phosphofructokinase [Actinobacteria bacterium]|nr:6-phosphofructokinase [Actinomycetota bacterium]
MRIGVLTGGGDCPGLNAVIRAVTRRGADLGHEIVGIRHSWRGIVDRDVVELDRSAVSGILPRGGTILGMARFDPFLEERGVERTLAGIAELRLDAVVAIGGEGTLAIAHRLHGAHGVPVVGVPKTIDNDIGATDYSFGFDTAVQVCCEAIDRLHTTAESHNRIMVVEVMGRNAGWIALHAGMAAGADVILVPEDSLPIEDACDAIRERHERGRSYSIVVVAEGYALTRRSGEQEAVSQGSDAYGYVRLGGIGSVVADEIARATGYETRVTVLGHVQRGGTPTARDRVLATRFGLLAARLAHESRFGRMAALRGDRVVDVSLDEATGSLKLVPPEWLAAARQIA